MAGVRKRDLHELFRVMTMSVGDLLDEWFETDAIKGGWASTGVVGVWAGPRTPGTAYNLLHHALGELNGVSGLWGHVRGGMGGISDALARSAEAAGATIRTDAGVSSIDVRDGRATGVTLDSGEELRAPLVVSGVHPRTTVLDLAGAEHFPDEVVRDMRRYRSRGGSVKVNCILSEPPRSRPRTTACCSTGIALCPSIDYLERAWQDAMRGVPAEAPYVEVEVPSAVDPSLTDDGTTVMTLFTQYGPYREEDWPEGAREAYGQRCLDIVAEHAPNVKDALVHHEVLAPPDLERIFGLERRLDLPGRAGPRPDGVHAPLPAAGPLRHAGRRPLPLRRGHAPGRRRDGGLRAQRRAADPARPARAALPHAEARAGQQRVAVVQHQPGRVAARLSRPRSASVMARRPWGSAPT